MRQKITPFLWFDADGEEAAEFYVSIFDDARLGTVTRYNEPSADVSGRPEGSVMTVAFELEGQRFVALNGGPQFTFNPSVSFVVNCPTEAEVDELWSRLSEGGETLMALDSYPFSDRYGWLADRYGVSWQLVFAEESRERHIVPSLLFVGEQCGKAEAAIEFYTSVFENSGVGDVARYGPDQAPDREGTVVFADFELEGQRFAAMDSAQAHEFAFNEAISFAVDCEDQTEVDRLWETLTADGGRESQCGWLEDRFGVSWQITPTVLSELLADEDEERSRRVTEAMLGMRKLDAGKLEAAYEGA